MRSAARHRLVAAVLGTSCVAATLFAVLRMSATGEDAVAPGDAARGHPPLVLIHGYKASHLRDAATGDRRWLTARQALAPWTESIALPVTWHEEGGQWVQDADALVPDGCIRSVGSLFFKRAIYEKFFHFVGRQGRHVHEFSYDWRRDTTENARKFVDHIEKVAEQQKGPVQIVAHSMGGLLTLAALNMLHDLAAAGDRPKDVLRRTVHSVLFVGVPFKRRMSFLEDLHKGARIGFNGDIIDFHVQATYTSVYSLFPLDGRGLIDAPPAGSHDYTPAGEGASADGHSAEGATAAGAAGGAVAQKPPCCDVFDVEFWKANSVSIFRDDSPYPRDAAEAHMRRALAAAKHFLTTYIVAREGAEYPPIGALVASGHPTTLTAIRNGPKSFRGFDFTTAPKGDGDGRMLPEDALPPAGISYTRYGTRFGHGDMLSDEPVVVGALADLIAAGDKRQWEHAPK